MEEDEDKNNVAEGEIAAPRNADASMPCKNPVDRHFTTEVRTRFTYDSYRFSRSHPEVF